MKTISRSAPSARLAMAAALLAAIPVAACGPSVASEPMVELPARPGDAVILVFARDEKVPACPWEVIGSVSAEPGWALDPDALREASDAARKMGGHALLLAARSDAGAQVIRFLDPLSLCDPETGPTRP
ncbi:MAG: hypothetical protein R6X22_00480 [Gemmatimonadota bacterium]